MRITSKTLRAATAILATAAMFESLCHLLDLALLGHALTLSMTVGLTLFFLGRWPQLTGAKQFTPEETARRPRWTARWSWALGIPIAGFLVLYLGPFPEEGSVFRGLVEGARWIVPWLPIERSSLPAGWTRADGRSAQVAVLVILPYVPAACCIGWIVQFPRRMKFMLEVGIARDMPSYWTWRTALAVPAAPGFVALVQVDVAQRAVVDHGYLLAGTGCVLLTLLSVQCFLAMTMIRLFRVGDFSLRDDQAMDAPPAMPGPLR